MKNITISLDEDVARWARILAAKQGSSVSRLLANLLREKMVTEEGYRAAREQFFAAEARALREPGQALPSRDEVNDRAGLR